MGRPLSRRAIISSCLTAFTLLVFVCFRGQSQSTTQLNRKKVTIILTSHQTTGHRPSWLLSSLRQYTSPEYADLVDRVILVWNAVGARPPNVKGVLVLSPAVNSLNNRWVQTLPHIKTDAILNLDDDIAINKAAMSCMFRYWSAEPWRLVGPFVRRNEGSEYVMDELTNVPGSVHTMVLPRVLMLSKAHLMEYAAPGIQPLRDGVDLDEAHSDDLLLNLVAARNAPRPPLRIALPEKSVSDYGTTCSLLDVESSGGLADQTDRSSLRSTSLAKLLSSLPSAVLSESNEVAMCEAGQRSRVFTTAVSLRRWREMAVGDSRVLCPSLKSTPPPERTGPGEELQMYCPERDAAATDWVDTLERNPICGESRSSSKEKLALFESAKHQCGAWCVWDLRATGKEGWHRTEKCFEKFKDDEHECGDWFHQRPKLILAK
ncbi:hypothetical protein P7C70_g578, partial [Phenoliferia sp. Uapishka_3]